MKINTDGVLLGALAQAKNPASILDIGAGTGVVALMQAQRFPDAQVDAIEIDKPAAQTARANFEASTFSARLQLYHTSFQDFSKTNASRMYDHIVSNPPFFTNSLKNPDKQKEVARHTNSNLFEELARFIKKHLSPTGSAYFILPPDASAFLVKTAAQLNLYPLQLVEIRSSEAKPVHRHIIGLGFENHTSQKQTFIIYQSEKVYSTQYRLALKDFLTIFDD